jgi:hypothetical protein
VRLRNPRALRRSASSRPSMASVGPLEAWWSKKAKMSSRRRARVRPSWAISSQFGRHAAPDRVDQRGHGFLAAAPVRVAIGGNDLLIDQPGDLDREVFLGVEHASQPSVLTCGEQLESGTGDTPDAVERITSVCQHRPKVCCWRRWRIKSSLAPATNGSITVTASGMTAAAAVL